MRLLPLSLKKKRRERKAGLVRFWICARHPGSAAMLLSQYSLIEPHGGELMVSNHKGVDTEGGRGDNASPYSSFSTVCLHIAVKTPCLHQSHRKEGALRTKH